MRSKTENAGVYKSETGRAAVEAYYGKALDEYRAARLTRRAVATGFGRTQVFACGDPSRPPLMLLHGSMANSATWLGMLPDFSKDFSLYCVDIPGEPGLSEPVRMPLAPAPRAAGAPAAWLGQVLDGLGLASTAILGMSLGGFYALSFAIASPERVDALVLLATAGVAPQRRDFMFKVILCALLGAPGKRLLNRLIYHKAKVPPQIHEFQALVSANFTPVTEPIPIFSDEELRRLSMPLQYFGGDSDALLDTAKTAARLAVLCRGAEIHMLPDTGHAILDQWPAVKAFLVSHGGGSRT